MIYRSLVILLLFFFCSFTFSSCFGCDDPDSESWNQGTNPLLESAEIQKAIRIQMHVRELYKRANASVVRIETEQDVAIPTNPFFKHFFDIPDGMQTERSLGSGFFLTESGFIVTNYHVVANVDRIVIKLIDSSSHQALMIGYDKKSDLALLKIDTKRKNQSIEIGDSSNISVGDIVYAIGNPFGFSATLTSGVVSSANQKIESKNNVSRIQTDAAINPGNSGGPLLDIMGKVIGVNQMIYSDKGGSVGIGFAIPINYAMQVIERIKKEHLNKEK